MKKVNIKVLQDPSNQERTSFWKSKGLACSINDRDNITQQQVLFIHSGDFAGIADNEFLNSLNDLPDTWKIFYSGGSKNIPAVYEAIKKVSSISFSTLETNFDTFIANSKEDLNRQGRISLSSINLLIGLDKLLEAKLILWRQIKIALEQNQSWAKTKEQIISNTALRKYISCSDDLNVHSLVGNEKGDFQSWNEFAQRMNAGAIFNNEAVTSAELYYRLF